MRYMHFSDKVHKSCLFPKKLTYYHRNVNLRA